MAIIRWDPLALTRNLWRWPNLWDEGDWPESSWGENLDIYETDKEVVVKASVAGVDEDKVEITFDKGVVTITAAEVEEEKKGKKYYKKASRSYAYRVAIPGNIDLKAEPKAVVDKGVVTVTFKKVKEAQPKKIAVTKKGK